MHNKHTLLDSAKHLHHNRFCSHHNLPYPTQSSIQFCGIHLIIQNSWQTNKSNSFINFINNASSTYFNKSQPLYTTVISWMFFILQNPIRLQEFFTTVILHVQQILTCANSSQPPNSTGPRRIGAIKIHCHPFEFISSFKIVLQLLQTSYKHKSKTLQTLISYQNFRNNHCQWTLTPDRLHRSCQWTKSNKFHFLFMQFYFHHQSHSSFLLFFIFPSYRFLQLLGHHPCPILILNRGILYISILIYQFSENLLVFHCFTFSP